MADLKPCPFCGRTPTVDDCGDHRYFVRCKCGIAQDKLYMQKCDAIRRWNTRKTGKIDKDTNVPSTDCISRQAAIEAIKSLSITLDAETVQRSIEAVSNMPSAQPEIIRCTECKHYREYDSEYVENAVVVQCMADRYPISETIPDGWFCAGAERKDDE